MPDHFTGNQNPEFDENEYRAFEHRLISFSLGAGPVKRDEVLFHCGVTAGAEATRKQIRISCRRWKTFGIATSFLAVVSLSMQYWTFLHDSKKQEGLPLVQYEKSMQNQAYPKTPSGIDSHESRQSATLEPNIYRGNKAAHSFSTAYRTPILRAKDLDFDWTEMDEIKSVEFPNVFDNQSKPLQPKDYSLILSGGF